uniref:Uncharacterized protein n=1 Tax=Bionectria ochroleuca TaxID=29856 RepID=A0A8H7NEL2_BIOOC
MPLRKICWIDKLDLDIPDAPHRPLYQRDDCEKLVMCVTEDKSTSTSATNSDPCTPSRLDSPSAVPLNILARGTGTSNQPVGPSVAPSSDGAVHSSSRANVDAGRA